MFCGDGVAEGGFLVMGLLNGEAVCADSLSVCPVRNCAACAACGLPSFRRKGDERVSMVGGAIAWGSDQLLLAMYLFG